MKTQAQTIDEIFQGKIYEDEQGYNIFDFAMGLQPIDVDQDWKNETTTYTFDDGSKVAVSGPTYEISNA